MLAKLMLWLFPAAHVCPKCAHVLPSHRARFHAGTDNYICVRLGGAK
jgi:hypothetical protein